MCTPMFSSAKKTSSSACFLVVLYFFDCVQLIFLSPLLHQVVTGENVISLLRNQSRLSLYQMLMTKTVNNFPHHSQLQQLNSVFLLFSLPSCLLTWLFSIHTVTGWYVHNIITQTTVFKPVYLSCVQADQGPTLPYFT